jgi:hypothetical protein
MTESLLNKEGIAGGIGHRAENSPQITVLFDLMEHLPDKEGFGISSAAGSSHSGWNSALFRGALSRPLALGTGFGDRTSSSDGTCGR